MTELEKLEVEREIAAGKLLMSLAKLSKKNDDLLKEGKRRTMNDPKRIAALKDYILYKERSIARLEAAVGRGVRSSAYPADLAVDRAALKRAVLELSKLERSGE